MPGDQPDHLTHADTQILLALWNDLYRSDFGEGGRRRSGLTREELAERLVQQDSADTSKPFRTDSALFKHLTAIKKLQGSSGHGNWRMLYTDTTAARSHSSRRAGKNRDLYTLAEGEIVTWPETARMLMEVWNANGHHIGEDLLIRRILALRFTRGPEGPPLEANDIEDDIKWATDREYLDRYSSTLRCRQRMRFEIDYVGTIAQFCNVEG